MAGSKGVRAGRAYVELFAEDSKLIRGLKRASARLKAFGAVVGNVGRKMAMLGGAALAPLIGAAKVFSSMGDEVAKMSKRTGVGVETLSELRFVASQTGTEFGTLENGLRKMQRSIYDAGRGLSTQTDALSDLGLAFEDLDGLSPEAQFKKLADAISQIDDPTKKAAIAMSLFGRTGTNLLPMFANGAAGIEELQKEARRLGLTMSGKDAAAAEVFTDTIDKLWKAAKMAVFQIGAALAPAISDLVNRITPVVAASIGWVRENQVLVTTILKIAAAVTAAGIILMVIGKAASIAAIAFKAIAVVFGIITSPITLVVAGLAAIAAAIAYAGLEGDTFSEKMNSLKEIVGPILTRLKNVGIMVFSALGFAVKNWRVLMEYSFVAAIHGIIKFAGQAKHFLTVAVPGYLAWFRDNWRDVFQTIWNGMKTFATNVWTNLKNLWKAIKGLFKGEGWDFQWTGLMDGFESAIKELPNIAEREIGPLERSLSDRMDKLGEELSAKWQQHKTTEALKKRTKEDAGLSKEADAAAEIASSIKHATENLKTSSKKVAEKASIGATGTFNASALLGLQAGGVTDRIAKATESTSKYVKKISENTKGTPSFG